MKINRFAVVGHPIAHTMSPFIHSRLFQLSGASGQYGVFDIPPEALAEKLPDLKTLNGFNITIPHKQAIIPFLEHLDEKAAFFHSVNTVKNTDGELTGYTTDGTGFCRALESAGASLDGRTIILGAGGAARALAFEAALKGGRITVAARAHSLDAAEQLCGDLREKVPGVKADCCLLDRIDGQIDLLANATPVGMYPNTDACPVPEEVVRRSCCVFDAVYNPEETQLLRFAKKNSVQAVGGMSMLVWQAAAAQEIWYGAHFLPGDMEELCRDAVFEMKKEFGNIVLCGFMGCGKTTVGKLLAESMGREFVDLDQWIERNEKMTVSEIFKQKGEPEFRRLERDAAEELSKKSGLVIAAGGGTLTKSENTAAFRKNGVILFLDASLEVIRTRLDGDKSRPLLAGPDGQQAIERLYRERRGLYGEAADRVIPADGEAKQVTARIREAME